MSRCSSSAPASAEVVHFCFIRDIRVPVAGFTVDAAYLKEASFCGLPVVAFEEAAAKFAPAVLLGPDRHLRRQGVRRGKERP
jgi:hypothetical protein